MLTLSQQDILNMCDTYGVIKVTTGSDIDKQLEVWVTQKKLEVVTVEPPVSIYRLIGTPTIMR